MIALTSRPWAEIESTILLRPAAPGDDADGETHADEVDDDNEKCDLIDLLRGAADLHADLKVQLSSSVNEAACSELAALLNLTSAEAAWQLGSSEGLSVHSAIITNRPAGSWARFLFEADGAAPLPDPAPPILVLPVFLPSPEHSANDDSNSNQEDWRGKLPIEVQLARALAEAYGAPRMATKDQSKTTRYEENQLIIDSLPSKKEVAATQRDLQQHLNNLLSTGARADMRVRCCPATPAMDTPKSDGAPNSDKLAALTKAFNDDEAIATGEVEVLCHKFVLAYRSAYFRAAIVHAPLEPQPSTRGDGSNEITGSEAARLLPTVSLPDECGAAPSLSRALLKCLYSGRETAEEALVAEIEDGAHGGASSLVPLAYAAHSLMMPQLSYEALSVLARSSPTSKNASYGSDDGASSNGGTGSSNCGGGSTSYRGKILAYIDSANAPSLLSVAEQLGHPPLRRACVSYIVANLADVTTQSPYFADLVTPQRKATLSALAAGAQSNFVSCGCLLDDAREYLGMLNEALDEQRVRHSDAMERQQVEWQDWVEASRQANALAANATARFGPAPPRSNHDHECGIQPNQAPVTDAALHAHAHAQTEQKASLERKERLLKVDAALAAQGRHLRSARQFLRSQEDTFAKIGTLSAGDETKAPARVPRTSAAAAVVVKGKKASSPAVPSSTTPAGAANASPCPPPRPPTASPAVSSSKPPTGPLPEFVPRYEWQDVLPGQSIDAGLEVRLNVGSGIDSCGSSDGSIQNTRARIPPVWRLKVWVEPTVCAPLPSISTTATTTGVVVSVASELPHLRSVRFPTNGHSADDEGDDSEWKRAAKYFRRDIQHTNTVADLAAAVATDFTRSLTPDSHRRAAQVVPNDNTRKSGQWHAAIGLRGLPLHGACHDSLDDTASNDGNGLQSNSSSINQAGAAENLNRSQGTHPRPLAVSESGEVFWALAPDRPFSPNLWMRQSDLAAFVYHT